MSDRDVWDAEVWNDLQMKLGDLAQENDELKKPNRSKKHEQ